MESLNAEQECCLCQDSCNSLNDLKNHLQVVHNLKKSDRAVYVKLSVEEKLKKKTTITLEGEGFPEETDDAEEISEEFKAFLEAEVKSSLNFLFKDLFDVLDGKAAPDIPEGDLEEDFSIADIRDAFENLGEAMEKMDIPDSVMTSLREEFEAQKTEIVEEEPKRKQREKESGFKVESGEVSNAVEKPNMEGKREMKSSFKVPEKRSSSEAGLMPVTSDHSSRFVKFHISYSWTVMFPITSQKSCHFHFH